MKYLILFWSLFSFSACKQEVVIPENPHLSDPTYQYSIVKMQTDFGIIRIWLSYQTPRHQANFLDLVERKFYDGLTFHRVINDFIVQGGDPNGDGTGGPGYEIPSEIETNLKHSFGAIAAARLGDFINPKRRSSGSQFYFVESRSGAHFLDGQYTVFGMVVSGIQTVEIIGGQDTDEDDKPFRPIYIRSVVIEKYTRQQLLDLYQFDITLY